MKSVFLILLAAVVGSVVAIAARSFVGPADAAPVAFAEAPAVPVGMPSHGQSVKPEVPPPVYVGPGFVATSLPDGVVWVDGLMISGRKLWVYLSDGRVIREDTPGVTRADADGVVLDGHRVWMRRGRVAQIYGAPAGAAVSPPVVDSSPAAHVSVVADGSSPWRLDPDGVYRLVSPSSIGGGGRR